MLDIKFIRENKDLIALGARKKNIKFDVDKLIALDDQRRELILAVEELRKKQNEVTDLISRKTYQNDRLKLIQEIKPLKKELQAKEEKLAEVMKEWQILMVSVPNVPDVSVPEGESDAENREIKTWGEIPKLDFEPKSHVELMTSLKMLDLERGTKVAGFRGYFLTGDGARLQFALWQFVNDFFQKKAKKDNKWIPMIVPSLLRREPFIGTGYLPQGEEDLYK